MTRQQKVARLDQGVKQMLFEAMSNGFGPATTKIRIDTNTAIGLGPDDVPSEENMVDDPEPGRPVEVVFENHTNEPIQLDLGCPETEPHYIDHSEQEPSAVGPDGTDHSASSAEDQSEGDVCENCGANLAKAHRALAEAVNAIQDNRETRHIVEVGYLAARVLDAHDEKVDEVYLSVPADQRAAVLAHALQNVLTNSPVLDD